MAAASICTPAELQTALTNAPTGVPTTIVLDPSSSCTFNLTTYLTVPAGVDITIEGNGHTLDGVTKTFDIIDVEISSTSLTSLTLNDIGIKNGS